MSDSELYVIEIDGDGGDTTTIRNLVQCTYTKGGSLDVSRRPITAMRRLIRCKECVHAHKSDYARWSSLVCDLGDGEIVGPDGFCSWGETEEDYADE